MAKPIFIITLPESLEDDNFNSLSNHLQKKLNDYHVLLGYNTDLEKAEYDVFYEKDFNNVKFEKLKQIIKDSLKKNNYAGA